MATKLSVYKEASLFLGDVRVASETDDIPLRYSFDDEYNNAVQYVLRAAPWRFATKTAALGASGSPIAGFSNSFAKPNDWRRSLAIFVHSGSRECPIHCREQDTKVYANVAAPNVVMRYISDDGKTESGWPEQFAKAVAAYLAFKTSERDTGNSEKTQAMWQLWQQNFAEAARLDAVPENPWLQYQLDGSFYTGVRRMLEAGFWRFAMKTAELSESGTPSSGYAYAFPKPVDFDRTFHLYRQISSGVGAQFEQIDFRDEDGHLHANYDPIVLRYVSTDGEDATTWSDAFEEAVLAYLQFEGAKRDPDMAGAQLQARAMAYERAFEKARTADDETERPRVLNTGRLVKARRGSFGHFHSEQGW